MCYSAQVWADYRQYVRSYGAELSVKDFFELFVQRMTDTRITIPKAMEMAFAYPQTDEQAQIRQLIDQFKGEEASRIEQELFKQRKRLADAERGLLIKQTKKDLEHQRIATNKIEQRRRWLADLNRVQLTDEDSRIWPQNYAPVMVMEGGRRVIKPMRYLLRRAGAPVQDDIKYSACYNARRDNLEGFWKRQFGYTHGLVMINTFYENVDLHRTQHRELAEGEEAQNVILQFKPRPAQDMLLACLWSRWTKPGQPDLLSFAAITDEPPPEVAAAGHDRCVIPIQYENIDAWLNPNPKKLSEQYGILDDRERPYYEHRMDRMAA